MSKHIELAVDILVNEMVDSGAPNYKSWLMECNDGNEYLVTVQKKDGETAVEQLAKNKQEIIEYKAFMLGLKLSSEDEARMLSMFAKYKKVE